MTFVHIPILMKDKNDVISQDVIPVCRPKWHSFCHGKHGVLFSDDNLSRPT